MAGKERKDRGIRAVWGWLVPLLLLLMLIPLFASSGVTLYDDTQPTHRLDSYTVEKQGSGGDGKIDGNLPGVGNSDADEPSFWDWLTDKIRSMGEKVISSGKYILRGLVYGIIGAAIVAGGLIVAKAGLILIVAGIVLSIIAAVVYSVMTGENGFVWWKAVLISVTAGLSVMSFPFIAARAAALWGAVQNGLRWIFERLMTGQWAQKLGAALATMGTYLSRTLANWFARGYNWATEWLFGPGWFHRHLSGAMGMMGYIENVEEPTLEGVVMAIALGMLTDWGVGKVFDGLGYLVGRWLKSGDDVVKGTRNIPQGLTSEQFSNASKLIRQKVGDISDDIVVQGSRAGGTAKATSDIDFAIRVSPEQFDDLVKHKFGTPNVGSAKERTMLNAIKTGKIQSGEAGLRGLRKQLQEMLGIDVDISIIKSGGPFDSGPTIELPK